jgi:hypothetical protein
LVDVGGKNEKESNAVEVWTDNKCITFGRYADLVLASFFFFSSFGFPLYFLLFVGCFGEDYAPWR